PPASTPETIAARRSNAARSKRACRLLPPSSSAMRGRGSVASAGKSVRARASQASSTGFRLPSRVTTLGPARPSCSGATTRSQCAGSMRGSRICTALAPASRSSRVDSAAWRPQPIASAGGASRKAVANPDPNAIPAPGSRRGAAQRHGARGSRDQLRADSRPSAAASERAWRRLPAWPSVRVQVVPLVRDIEMLMVDCSIFTTLRSGQRVPGPVPELYTGGLFTCGIHRRGDTFQMSQALTDAAFDQLFRTARTYNRFSGQIDDATLHRLYDLLKWGPTSANQSPARFVFVRSPEAKARLEPALDEGNRAKTMEA